MDPDETRPRDKSLPRALKRLGTHQLAALIGNRHLQAIAEVTDAPITETRLVGMLLAKHGNQVLADSNVRRALLPTLPAAQLAYILRGSSNETSQTDIAEVGKLRWERRSDRAHRVLSVFGLDDDHLPPEHEEVPATVVSTPSYALLPYQQRVKDAIVREMTAYPRVLVHMPTGSGKTRTTAEAIVDYIRSQKQRPRSVVWLAHTEELCEQAFQTLMSTWESRGDRTLSLHRLWGSHELGDIGADGCIVVAGLQKAHSLRTAKDNTQFRRAAALASSAGLVVIDEAHKAIAPTYRAVLEYLVVQPDTRLVGLTATPGRGLDPDQNRAFAEFFEHRRVSLTDDDGHELPDPIGYLQERQYLARLRRERLPTNVSLHLTEVELDHLARFLELPPSVLRSLADDPSRNALLVQRVANLAETRRAVLVFALSVEHAHLLSDLLTMRGIAAAVVDGKTPSRDRQARIDAYRNGDISVLVNFGVLTTGFDAPITDTVVIARPTASVVLYSQMIGRGIRGPRFRGPAETLLVDLEDNLVGFPSESHAFNYFDHLWSAADEPTAID